jgi:hypothetical protein
MAGRTEATSEVECFEPRRRLFLTLSALAAATAGLAACAKEDDPAAAVTGANHDGVAEALDALGSAIDDLGTAIDRFDDDNWRDVVPDVRTSATDVSNAADQLKDLLADNG